MYTRKLINCLGGLNNNLNTISNTIGNIFTTGGNVGIGTTSPSSLFHVNGSLTASSISNSSLNSSNNTFSNLVITQITSDSAIFTNLISTNLSTPSLISTNITCSGISSITNSIITNISASNLYTNQITSINLEPKIAMTSTSTGGYIVTSSSSDFPPGWIDWKAFDKITNQDGGWHTPLRYNVSTGAYTGSVSTIVDSTVFLGEWITLQTPFFSKINSVNITPREGSSLLTRSPRNFTIAGSTGGSVWSLLATFTGVTWANTNPRNFSFTLSDNINYIRLIVNRVGNQTSGMSDAGYLNIREIEYQTESNNTINNLITTNISSENIIALNTIKTGSIFMWLTNTAPTGYFICNGASLSTVIYPDLFSILGYTYGGSGTTFNLPDLRGRVPLGGTSFGTTGGSETHTLTISEMPSHQHTVTTDPAGSHSHELILPASETSGGTPGFIQQSGSGSQDYFTQAAGSHSHTFFINTTGGGQPHNNMQPYLVVNYIIKF